MTTIGRITVVGQPDVLLQNVVIKRLHPLELQGKIFFKKNNMFTDEVIDIFVGTISDILKETPIGIYITKMGSDNEDVPVTVIKKTCYQVVTEIDFTIEGLKNKDKNIFNILSSLVEACLRYAIKTKETKDLYEAIEKDFEMYKSDTSTKEEECN